jgi:gluconate 5-dehydrogenase
MADTPFSLSGRHALITGGGTGIGLAVAQAFGEAGAQVIITGRREEVLRQACKNLGAYASYRVCDLSELDTVNNAGINAKKPAMEVTDEEFARIVQTNLHGLFTVSREVARGMIARGRGAILNITSMAALYGLSKVAAYSASKTAVLGLTRTLAVEWAPHGIRVNAIAPGFIFSEMTERALNSDPERKRRVLERTPMGRMGEAREIGAAALFLCSEAASFITGVNLPVDGGNSIGF